MRATSSALLLAFGLGAGAGPAPNPNGAPTAEALVRRWVAAVAAADTPTLRRLHVSRTTFDSFFPYLPGTARRMGRDALWLILLLNSEKGIARTLQRRPIDPGRYRGLACAEPPRRRGPLMLWTDCRVRRARPGGGEDTVRLFGSLVHWQGRWRFLSYANDF